MGLMFPGFLIVSTKEGRQRNSLSFKERARVRMGSTDHDNSPHPHPSLPLEGERACVCARSSLAHRRVRWKKTGETSEDGVANHDASPFINSSLLTRHFHPVTCHLSPATCYSSFVTRHLSLVTRHPS